MKAKKTGSARRKPEIIGWREHVALPELGIPMLRAKIDTGARTSAIHADHLEIFEREGARWVRFRVPASRLHHSFRLETPIADEREIKNTSGIPETRIVIETLLLLGRHRWHVEVSLANRENMGFDMILGRTAVRRRGIRIDPGRSFLAGDPQGA